MRYVVLYSLQEIEPYAITFGPKPTMNGTRQVVDIFLLHHQLKTFVHRIAKQSTKKKRVNPFKLNRVIQCESTANIALSRRVSVCEFFFFLSHLTVRCCLQQPCSSQPPSTYLQSVSRCRCNAAVAFLRTTLRRCLSEWPPSLFYLRCH